LVEVECRKRKHEEPVPSSSKYEELCSLIAVLSEEILENPEAAFSMETNENNSKFGQLLNIADSFDVVECDYNICRLAIISLVAIFQDVLPAYRVRLPTSSELSVKVKKETKRLWDYERVLLLNYQRFLKLLEKTWDKYKYEKKVGKQKHQMGLSAMLCLCEILKAAHQFNFRSNILTLVVRQMSSNITEVSNACCSAIETIFVSDRQGEISVRL